MNKKKTILMIMLSFLMCFFVATDKAYLFAMEETVEGENEKATNNPEEALDAERTEDTTVAPAVLNQPAAASTIKRVGDVYQITNADGAQLNYQIISVDAENKKGEVRLGKLNGKGPSGSSDANGLVAYTTNGILTIPSTVNIDEYNFTVTEVGRYALSGAKLNTLNLPEGTLRTISENALRDNQFTNLVIPEGVTRIGDMALSLNGQLKMLKLPSTLQSLGASLFQNNSVLSTIYFPVDAVAFIKDDASKSNVPFYGLNFNQTNIIVKTKEQYDKWRMDTTIIHASNTTASKAMVTYEIEVSFYDRELNKLSIPSIKKLYGKAITYAKDDATQQWSNRYTCTDLPPIPDKTSLGYEANYWAINSFGVATVDKSGNAKESSMGGTMGYGNYTIIIDGKLIAVENELEPIVTGVDKTFDNTAKGIEFSFDRKLDDGFFVSSSRYVAIFLEPLNGSMKGAGFTSFPIEIGTTESSETRTRKFVNVADSGTYQYSLYFYDKLNSFNPSSLVWMSNPATQVQVSIKPADIKINPQISNNELVWEEQQALPKITLGNGDTPGVIQWDDGQTPQLGSHEYTYTFIPDNLYADGIKGKDIANYTETQKKGSLKISYQKKVKKIYVVNFRGFNGITLKSELVEEHSSATAPVPPTIEGYQFVKWDKEFHRVESDLVVQAIYEKQKFIVTYVDNDGTWLSSEEVLYGGNAMHAPVLEKAGFTFIGWDGSQNGIKRNITLKAQYRKHENKLPPIVNPPVESPPPVVTSPENSFEEAKEPPVNKSSNEEAKLAYLENKKEGVRVESVNNEKIFDNDISIHVQESPKAERSKAEKELKNVIKVLDVTLEKDGVKVKEQLNSKIQLILDAKDYSEYKDIKIYQKNADGSYIELDYVIQDDKIIFECDALDTYALTGTKIVKEKVSCPICGHCANWLGICNYVWFTIDALVLGVLCILVIKRKRKKIR